MLSEESRKYRSDTEILYEILKVIVSSGEGGIKKTHLMYRTNLNSKMLQRYLDMLQNANIIEENQYGKQKIVRLSPLGKTAYASLKTLIQILFPREEPEEIDYIKAELKKLTKDGWDVSFDKIVTGKTGADYLPQALIVKKGKRYLVKFIIGSNSMDAGISLMNFLLEVLDTRSKGIVITDKPEIEDIILDKLRDDVKIVASRPIENLLERVKKALEE